MYNVQCTMYNVQCTMYNEQSAMYNECTLTRFSGHWNVSHSFRFGASSQHDLSGSSPWSASPLFLIWTLPVLMQSLYRSHVFKQVVQGLFRGCVGVVQRCVCKLFIMEVLVHFEQVNPRRVLAGSHITPLVKPFNIFISNNILNILTIIINII